MHECRHIKWYVYYVYIRFPMRHLSILDHSEMWCLWQNIYSGVTYQECSWTTENHKYDLRYVNNAFILLGNLNRHINIIHLVLKWGCLIFGMIQYFRIKRVHEQMKNQKCEFWGNLITCVLLIAHYIFFPVSCKIYLHKYSVVF